MIWTQSDERFSTELGAKRNAPASPFTTLLGSAWRVRDKASAHCISQPSLFQDNWKLLAT
jgi:hypothetical protein